MAHLETSDPHACNRSALLRIQTYFQTQIGLLACAPTWHTVQLQSSKCQAGVWCQSDLGKAANMAGSTILQKFDSLEYHVNIAVVLTLQERFKPEI